MHRAAYLRRQHGAQRHSLCPRLRPDEVMQFSATDIRSLPFPTKASEPSQDRLAFGASLLYILLLLTVLPFAADAVDARAVLHFGAGGSRRRCRGRPAGQDTAPGDDEPRDTRADERQRRRCEGSAAEAHGR